MNIKEAKKLISDEKNGVLRKPINAQSMTEAELKEDENVMAYLNWFIKKQAENGNPFNTIIRKRLLNKQKGIKITGKGSDANPFKITTRHGKAVFWDSRSDFKDKKHPDYIKYNYCHDNCVSFARVENVDCEILNGIAYIEKAFTHSVILIDDYILDFNYNLCMEKEMYLKLTKFEIINRISSQTINDDFDIVMQNLDKIDGMDMKLFILAYDEIVSDIKENDESLKKWLD